MDDVLVPLSRSQPEIGVGGEFLDHGLNLLVVGLLEIEELLPRIESTGFIHEGLQGLVDGLDDFSHLLVLVDVLVRVEAGDGAFHRLNLLLKFLLLDLHLIHEGDLLLLQHHVAVVDQL